MDNDRTTAAALRAARGNAETVMRAELEGITMWKGALHYLRETRRLVDSMEDGDPEAFATLAFATSRSIERDTAEAGAEAERLAAIELREAAERKLLEIPLRETK